MGKYIVHCNNLGACEICGNCMEKNHPWYYCYTGNNNFGNISNTNDCEDFIYLEDEDIDDNEDDFNPNDPIECRECGEDAYWEGTNYVCDNCGWCGISNN